MTGAIFANLPRSSLARAIVLVLSSTFTFGSGCGLPFPNEPGNIECLIIPGSVHEAYAALRPERKPSWSISWFDETGTRKAIRGVTKPVTIRLPAGKTIPVILFEETDIPGFSAEVVPPAGAIFPTHAEGGSPRPILHCDRIKGALARCAETAILNAAAGPAEGMNLIAGFDWSRLDSLVKALDNPVAADTGLIAGKILGGFFSSRYAVERAGFQAGGDHLSGIPAGTVFYSAVTGDGRLEVGESGVFEVWVRDGLNRFFSLYGMLDLQAENGLIVCTFLRSYD